MKRLLFLILACILVSIPFSWGAGASSVQGTTLTDWLVRAILVPGLAYAGELVYKHVREWLSSREYNKALMVWDVLARAVQASYNNGVREAKSSGNKLTEELKTAAMSYALKEARNIAFDEKIDLPPEEDQKMIIDQIIADRKAGVINPFAAWWKRMGGRFRLARSVSN